jgi:hypothetical protein
MNTITSKWISDTGLVLTAILILFGLFGVRWAFGAAFIVVILQLVWVNGLYPIAWVWFQVVRGLSYIQPKILFSIIFYLVVVPIGLVRRITHTSLREKEKESNFVNRTHTYTLGDIEQVY